MVEYSAASNLRSRQITPGLHTAITKVRMTVLPVKSAFFALLLLGAIPCSLPRIALAQSSDKDPFGSIDDDDDEDQPAQFGSDGTMPQPAALENPGVQQPGANTATAQTLLGSGEGSGVNPTSTLKVKTPSWGDLNKLTGERVEDTYEMQMRNELSKPMPKHDPFGDRMGDMKAVLKPVPDKK